MSKTVAELREIVRVVKARGDDVAKDSELRCKDCGANEACGLNRHGNISCVLYIEKWCDEQDAQIGGVVDK